MFRSMSLALCMSALRTGELATTIEQRSLREDPADEPLRK